MINRYLVVTGGAVYKVSYFYGLLRRRD